MQCFGPGAFPVEGVRRRRTSSLVLTETRYGGHEALPQHAHERACIVVLFEGSFTEEYVERGRSCTAPTILIRPPAEPHADRFGKDGGRVLNVEIPDGWPAHGRAVELPHFSHEIRGPERERLAVRLLHEFDRGATGARRVIPALVSEALTAWIRTSSARALQPPAVRRARSLIEHRFRSAWSLSRVAAQVGMHPASLARAFRRCHGESLGQYVRRLRVRMACRLLSRTDASLAEVAVTVGFWDQAHFTRSFRAVTGITPAKFVRLLESR